MIEEYLMLNISCTRNIIYNFKSNEYYKFKLRCEEFPYDKNEGDYDTKQI